MNILTFKFGDLKKNFCAVISWPLINTIQNVNTMADEEIPFQLRIMKLYVNWVNTKQKSKDFEALWPMMNTNYNLRTSKHSG